MKKFYKPFNIKYKGLKLLDVSQANISIHFTEISDFIDEGLSSGGKVLVNCQKGVSRSSAAVLAYLMLRHNMTAVDALIEVGIGNFVINTMLFELNYFFSPCFLHQFRFEFFT